jgi:hypothetical protein
VQRPISHEGYSQPMLTTWDRRHKRNQPGMISSLKEAGCGFLPCFFRSPADFLYVLPMIPMLPLSYACRSAGAWGKLLLCSRSGGLL